MTMLAEPIVQSGAERPSPPNPHQLFPSEIEEMQSQDHFNICARFVTALDDLFQSDENANVGGDVGFYWNSEDDRDRAAPDAYLIRNASKEPRKSWKFWEERAAHPNLTIEFTLEVWSESNRLFERRKKLRQYQDLNVQEFFELDSVTGDLAGQRLVNGQYEPLDENEHGRLFSQSLNAEIAFEDGLLRLYRDGQRILTLAEAQAALNAERAAKEAERAAKEAERAAKEAALAEIERLKQLLGK